MTSGKQRFSPETRNLILFYRRQGLSYSSISKLLYSKHFVRCTRQGVRKFARTHDKTGLVNNERRPGRDALRKIKPGHRQFINLWMAQNPETTAKELCCKLYKLFKLKVSVSLINKIRQELRWSGKKTEYCALISVKNVLKRESWALHALSIGEDFRNVVFVDETSIEMSTCGRFVFNQKKSHLDVPTSKAPKAKHSYKVHMWAGISYMGRTDCCLFTGIMDSVIYQQILEKNFLPFVRRTHPNGFRLYQDNDSKHCSKSTKEWLEKKNISHTVMTVPASSPDLNPIENVWSSLKYYLQRHVKPRKRDELVFGIKQFWQNLTAEQCGRYIDHIHKVIPEVCLNRGGPTQY